MRKKILLGVIISLFIFFVLTPHNMLSSKDLASHPQNVPDKKPKYDYMSTLLSRTTPLGLKMGPELEKLLKQPSTKWAIRVGAKHVLD